MRKRYWIAWTISLLGILAVVQAVDGQTQPAQSSSAGSLATQRAILDQYCVTCHNEKAKASRLASGVLVLEKMDIAKAGENPEVWEKVVRKLRAGMMPPLGSKRPEPAAYEAFTVWLENELDRTAAAKPNFVRPGIHRLNRTEYANSIRDLLSIEIDAASLLPVDDSSYGFDNVASALGISPALLDAYISAAGKISRLALGRETDPAEKNLVAPQDYSQDNHIDGLPLGTRGGVVLRYYFPADGEYAISFDPVRGNTGELFGGNRKGEQAEVLIDGERLGLFSFDDPKLQQGTDQDKNEVRVPVKAGLRTVGVAFINKQAPIDDLNQHYIRSVLDTNPVPGYVFAPQIGRLKIMGPYNAKPAKDTPSRRKILSCTPRSAQDEAGCAKQIVTSIARQAFRRPVNEEDLESLMSFYEDGRKGGDFESGIEGALQRILADPEFVFRTEGEPANVKPGQTYRISDLELASRLSYFLWSTAPDEELIGLAGRRGLSAPGVLEKQVKRMLGDPRAHQFAVNFAGQWWQLRNLASKSPTTQTFPDFDDNLRQAFRTEAEMFFESIMREDRSVIDLLNADYTFVNERLSRHYGIPSVYGSHFRRVSLSGSLEVRRGMLGKGGIQLVTSLDDRTSPVERGKWVLMNILGIIPPEPPPNVPLLKETGKVANGQVTASTVSMRKRMEEHRANPNCSSCHRMMDPIGFTLENFNAVGAWRTREGGQGGDLIDPSGELSDGTKIDGPLSLTNALVKYSPQFVRTLTEKLLTYGLGRGTAYYDMPVVRSIVKEAARDNYRFSSLIVGIVKSAPFQHNMKAASSVASK